ncbi:putative Fatty acid synthase subunit alpha [Glarea lozoyensis 74030]|uniref:Putative Fatty acid synthase subunit alpha n=1 Tax=Glarea lozoyensis (strain ATCC 74030 / MF5533) TaxID=1104152 RepID=H0EC83_GLAL7|nr:putative Fatty acid synthase subunit alpha [Glarea lozoyensis 74030]
MESWYFQAIVGTSICNDPKYYFGAKELLDKAAKVYAETCGLTLQAQSNKLDQHVNAESVMSPSAMLSVQQEAKSQRHLATRQVLALSEYLGINLGGNNDSESEVLNRALRNKLAVWKDEFGDDFALGMKAHFDSRLNTSRVCLRRAGSASEEDLNLTHLFFHNISEILQNGANFSGKCILITGAGSGSIGVELVKYLLNGGAHVIVATSRPSSSSSKFYRDIYAEHGSRGSQIHVVPFNQASAIDCKELIEPTQVILPLSPNHGIFGGDGLYSESKLGLEGLLNRFHSESWSEEITVVGLIIGWTRGTSLMQQNDIVAQAIEERGVLTFSQKEMALNILTLLSPEIAEVCDEVSIIADFSGGLGRLENCNQVLSSAREKIRLESQILKAKMVDLSGTVVVVGYSELGPWGNARTRWEKESQNRLTQSAYVELAWMMNLIKYFDGDTPQGYFVGWVDTKSGEQVLDSEVEGKYGDFILSHSGIRFIDPDLSSGYDPTKKEFLQEIVVEEDLPEFETDYATAEGIKRRNGDKISFTHLDGQDQCRVQIKCGAHIMVPRSSNFNTSCVAGQLPKGWNAATYGVEEGIISQVDPVTLYALCCVAEALFSAGITNAMEVYKHIHTSEMGNFIGSSMGGTDKTRQMYRDVYLDKRVQGDIIQETFLNTPAAWYRQEQMQKAIKRAHAGERAYKELPIAGILTPEGSQSDSGGEEQLIIDNSFAESTLRCRIQAVQRQWGNELRHNVDPALEKFEHLVFPTEPIQMAEIKAFILTSFGFGQKGGQLIGVNPKYLLATLGKDCFEEYATKVTERKRLANRAFAKAVLTNSVFKAQTEPPYDPVDEAKVFLDPLARTSEVPETGEYRFERKNISGSTILTKAPNDASKMRAAATVDLATALTRSQTWISKTISDAPDNVKVGIDVEDLGAFTSDKNEIFVARNYTEDEISVARKSPDPHRSFVGRWCAKEAVFKSLGTRSKGAGAALKEIEIVDSGMGPSVKAMYLP